MIRVFAICLCCAACAPRPINDGAAIPVYRVPLADLQREYQAAGGTKAHIAAWCRFDKPAIWIPNDRHPMEERALLLHEFGHLVERQSGPGVWRLLSAMHTDDFPCGPDKE